MIVTALYLFNAENRFFRNGFSDRPRPGAGGGMVSILILRDAFHGLTRFDQFQRSLTIAPNILTKRLNDLVAAGLLERRLYNEHPPRHEYVLTEMGRDFRPVMITMMAWSNRHFAPE